MRRSICATEKVSQSLSHFSCERIYEEFLSRNKKLALEQSRTYSSSREKSFSRITKNKSLAKKQKKIWPS